MSHSGNNYKVFIAHVDIIFSAADKHLYTVEFRVLVYTRLLANSRYNSVMYRVIIELWPALLPALLFVLWHHLQVRKAKKYNSPSPLLKDGPWFTITLMSIGIAIACLLAFGVTQEHTKGEYVPAQLENGALKDGSIRP
jgi:formate-dependent nitrite reductase membrane component NrfD